MKHRRNKVKREHSIIQDALGWLEELSQCPQVSDIIPGVIEVSRSPERGVVYKYETQTGCKILLKSNGSIQEAFVVTQNPEIIRRWIETRFPSVSKLLQSPDGVKLSTRKKNSSKKVETTNTPSRKNKQSRKSVLSQKEIENKYLRNEDFDSNLGQRVNANTRQALKALQKDLRCKLTQRKN